MNLYKNTIWHGTPSRVSILVPTRDTVYSHFSHSLAGLVKVSTQMGIDVHVFFNSATILIEQREQLVNQAISLQSEWLLWLDSDMMFPSTTLLRLLAHNEDIVGCNYMKRSYPFSSVAYTNTKDWDSWVPLQSQDELLNVEGVGMGCVLMKTSVFQKLNKPYFEYTYNPETKGWTGEDFVLFNKLKNVGYQLKIDTNLSNEIYHIGTFAYGKNLDVNVQKKREVNQKRKKS
jgi:hypothetical protein